MSEVVGYNTKFDKVTDASTQAFLIANLQTPMNSVTRRMSITHMTMNITEAASKWQKGIASEAEIQNLLKIGIDAKGRDRFLDLVAKHSEVTENGVLHLNLDKWGKDGLELTAYLKREVDNIILIPGATDKPLWMKRPFLKLVGQFRGFSSAAFSRALLPNLQDIFVRGGEQALVGVSRMTAGIALGAAGYVARQKMSGKEVDYDGRNLFMEGMDRGGIFPVIMDLNNIVDRFGYGLGSAIGVNRFEKFGQQSLLGQVVGVSGSTLDNSARVLAGLGDGEVSQSDMKRMAKMLPMQNLLYWNWLTTKIGQDPKRKYK
jgi:hypothetical protein